VRDKAVEMRTIQGGFSSSKLALGLAVELVLYVDCSVRKAEYLNGSGEFMWYVAVLVIFNSELMSMMGARKEIMGIDRSR
jgi:hypothetical protein